MYTQEITRKHRSAILLLIDRSASMQEIVCMGKHNVSKAEAVTIIASAILTELIDRCHRIEGLRNYYDVAVIGYGNDTVEMLLGEEDFISIERLARRECTSHRISYEVELPNGESRIVEHNTSLWFEPKAEGNTPMYEALLKALTLVERWCLHEQNRDSFPPIVVNITDGEMSDCNPSELLDISTIIRRQATNDGNTLLLNIHIEPSVKTKALIFPTKEELQGASAATRLFAEASSVMPELFNQDIIRLKGEGYKPPFIGMGYNANILELLSIINIGSRSGPLLQ